MEPLPFHPEDILSARETFRRLSAARRAARQRPPTLYVVATCPTVEFVSLVEALPASRKALLKAQDGLCYLCREPFTKALPPTTEHVIPKARGGGNAGNILLACSPCNSAKGDRLPTPEEMAYLAAVNAILERPAPVVRSAKKARQFEAFKADMAAARERRLNPQPSAFTIAMEEAAQADLQRA